MSDLSKHIVFTIENLLWAVFSGLREHTFSTLLSGHFLFVIFRDFLDLWCQKGTQKVVEFRGEMCQNSTPSPKSSQGTPREAQELPNDAKMLPKSAKMKAQGP